jgi:hypothetical protein
MIGGSARFCGPRRSRATRGSLSTRNGPLQRIIVWVVHGGCVVRRNEGRKCGSDYSRKSKTASELVEALGHVRCLDASAEWWEAGKVRGEKYGTGDPQ